MQQAGYNVAREVLLAIRQGNQQRVEHLVEGLVAALRLQRTSSGDFRGEGAPRASEDAAAETSAHAWGAGVHLGTSVEQFAFAVHRLSRLSLGPQHAPFWDEVSGFVISAAGELQSKELALLCNAYATSAPDRLPGPIGSALLTRAAAVAEDLSAQDLTMVLHGLARGVNTRSSGGMDICVNTQSSFGVTGRRAVKQLARAARKVRLEEERPQQAALLLHAFARLQHSHDAHLFGRWFALACKTLPAWNSQQLALLCGAFATVGREAHAHTTESGWRAIAGRCAAILSGANGEDMASFAHALNRIHAPPAAVAEFYDRLEQLLCSRPRVNDFLTVRQFAMVLHGLARHRRPDSTVTDVFPAVHPMTKATAAPVRPAEPAAGERAAVAAPESGVSRSRGDGRGSLEAVVPATDWPFEEYAARRVREFSQQDLVLVLHASVRLQRGGVPLFKSIASRIRGCEGKLSALGLAKLCESAMEAVPAVGISVAADLLRVLRKECIRLTPRLSPWEVSSVAAACALVAAATPEGKGRPRRIWKNQEQARAALGALCARADEVSPHPDWLEHIHSQVRQVMEAEGLLVTTNAGSVEQSSHRERPGSLAHLV
mmetsp:Transcript_110954/g.324557  ORF Transcript_110954/g.324557 Transcript_110954/m.324557 type:complete len:603 (-) Transcript_110954:90-1898(-)